MRKLTPELLDHLPHDDPGAIRSRLDLRRVNRFMRTDSWVLRNLPPQPSQIVEIGAGDGHLLACITKQSPGTPISAYDFAPRPAHLPPAIRWHRGDLFNQPAPEAGGVLIASLFLHHFTNAQLSALAPWLHRFDKILINEPLRSKFPQMMGKLATPFIHPITRHDMKVSIEAGFVRGELPVLLGLQPNEFCIKEFTTWQGSLRLIAESYQLTSFSLLLAANSCIINP